MYLVSSACRLCRQLQSSQLQLVSSTMIYQPDCHQWAHTLSSCVVCLPPMCMCSTDKRSRQLQLASSAQLQTVNLIAQGQVSAVFWLGCNYSAQSHTVASATFKFLICQPSCSSQWVNTKVHRTWCPSNGGREDIGFVVNMLAVHIWRTYRSEDQAAWGWTRRRPRCTLKL